MMLALAFCSSIALLLLRLDGADGKVLTFNPTQGAVNNWDDKTNWTPGQVPTASDDVVIDSYGNYTVYVRYSAYAASLTVTNAYGDDVVLWIRNHLQVNGPCDVGGNLTIETTSGRLSCKRESYLRGTVVMRAGYLGWSSLSTRPLFNVEGNVVVRGDNSRSYFQNVEISLTGNMTLTKAWSSNVIVSLSSNTLMTVEEEANLFLFSRSSVYGQTLVNYGHVSCEGRSDDWCRMSVSKFENHGTMYGKDEAIFYFEKTSYTSGLLKVDTNATIYFSSSFQHYFTPDSIINITGTLHEYGGGQAEFTSSSIYIRTLLKRSSAYISLTSEDTTVENVTALSGTLNFQSSNSTENTWIDYMRCTSARIEINAAVHIRKVDLTSSTIAIKRTLTVTEELQWRTGTISGTGTLDVSGACILNSTTAVDFYLYVTKSYFRDVFLSTASSRLRLSSYQTYTLAETAVATFPAGFQIYGSTESIFENYGTVDFGSDYRETATINPRTFNNYGTVTVGARNASMQLNVQTKGIVDGKFIVNSGSTLNFDPRYGNLEEGDDGSVSGEGDLLITSSSYAVSLQSSDIKAVVVSGGNLDLHPSTGDGRAVMSNITVHSGRCTVDVYDEKDFYLEYLELRSGQAYFKSSVTVGTVRQTGGSLYPEGDVTVRETYYWTSGTVTGTGFNAISASRLQLEGRGSVYLRKSLLTIQQRFLVLSRSFTFYVQQGSQVVIGENVETEFGGSSFTLSGDDTSQIVNYGSVLFLDAETVLDIAWLIYGKIQANNSVVTFQEDSTCSGKIAVNENSTVTLSKKLDMSPSAKLTGKGQVTITGSSSNLYGVTLNSLKITSGSVTVYLGAEEINTIEVVGGTATVQKAFGISAGQRIQRRVNKVILRSGTLESFDTFLINSLEILGGTFRANEDSYIHGTFLWTSGTLACHEYSNVAVGVTGTAMLKGTARKTLRSCLLVLDDEAVYRTASSFYFYAGAKVEVGLGGRLLVDAQTTFQSADSCYSENTITNRGTMTVARGRSVTISQGFENTGRLEVNYGATLTLSQSSLCSDGDMIFHDYSQFAVSGGTHTIGLGCSVEMGNTTTLAVRSRLVATHLPGSGTILVTGGLTVQDTGPRRRIGSLSVTGSGYVVIAPDVDHAKNELIIDNVTVSTSQHLEINRPMFVGQLVLDGGYVRGASSFNVSHFVFRYGYLTSTTPVSVIVKTMTIDLRSHVYVQKRILFLEDSGIWPGSPNSYYMYFREGAQFVIGESALFRVEDNQYFRFTQYSSLVVRGEMEFYPALTIPATPTISGTAYNYGTLRVLGFTALRLVSADCHVYGTVDVRNANSTFRIDSGRMVYRKSAKLTGSGVFKTIGGVTVFESSREVTLEAIEVYSGQLQFTERNGQLYIPTIKMKSSSARFTSYGQLSCDNFFIEAGIVDLRGQSNFSFVNFTQSQLTSQGDTFIDEFLWYGGTIDGSGRVTVNDGTIASSFSYYHYLSGSVILEIVGTTSLVGRVFSINMARTSSLVIDVGGALIFTEGHKLSGSGKVVNRGVFQFTGDRQNQAYFYPTFENAATGLISILSDTIRFLNSLTNEGVLHGADGALIYCQALASLSGSTIDVRGRLVIQSESYLHAKSLRIRHFEISGSKTLMTVADDSAEHVEQLQLTRSSSSSLEVQSSSHGFQLKNVLLGSGTLKLSVQGNITGTLRQYGGTLEANSPLAVSHYEFWGGTVKGTSAGTISVARINIVDSARYSKYVYSKTLLLTGTSSTWRVNEGNGGRFTLYENAKIVVDDDAQLNITYQYAATVMSGKGKFINRGLTVLSNYPSGDGLPPSPFRLSVPIINNKEIRIARYTSVMVDTLQSCDGNITVDPYGFLRIRESESTADCSVSGNVMRIDSGTVFLPDRALDLNRIELYGGKLIVTGPYASVRTLYHYGGTIQGAHLNATLTVKTLYKSNYGTIKDLTLTSEGRLNVYSTGYVTIDGGQLLVKGTGTFLAQYLYLDNNGSIMISSQGHLVISGTSIRQYIRYRGQWMGKIINYGTLQTDNDVNANFQNAILINRGTFEMIGANGLAYITSYPSSETGIIKLTGAYSQLGLVGSSNHVVDAGSSSCATCAVYLSTSGASRLKLQSDSWHQTNFSYLQVNSGTVEFATNSGDKDVVLQKILVSRGSLILDPVTSLPLVIVSNGGRVQGNSSTINELHLAYGNVGESKEPRSLITVKKFVVDSISSSSNIYFADLTVTNSSQFVYGTLQISQSGRLVLDSKSNNVMTGSSPQISGQGECIVRGTLSSNVDASTTATISSSLTNEGLLRAVNGKLVISGSSTTSGSLTVDKTAEANFQSSVHTFTSAAAISVLGRFRQQSGSSTLRFKSLAVDNLVVSGGTVDVLSTACLEFVKMTSGTMKVSSNTAVNRFEQTGGGLSASSVFSVNGHACFTGGSMSKSGAGSINFNGATCSGSKTVPGTLSVNSPDSSCPTVSCANCVGRAGCAWFADMNACRLSSSMSGNSASSCQSWIASAANCLANNDCSNYDEKASCAADAKCGWCASSGSCLSSGGTCDGAGAANAIYWTSDDDGSWRTTSSWDLNRRPTSTDNVYVSIAKSVTITSPSSETIKSLTVGTSTGDRQPTLYVSSSMKVQGSVVVLKGATLRVTGSFSWTGDADIRGTLVWDSGTVSGTTLNVYGSMFTRVRSYNMYMNTNFNLYGKYHLEYPSNNYYVRVQSGKSFTVKSSGELEVTKKGYLYGYANAKFINNGVVRFLNQSILRQFYVQLATTNAGEIDVMDNYRIYFQNGLKHEGSMSIKSTSFVQMTGTSIESKATISGEGSLRLVGSSTNIYASKIDVESVHVQGKATVNSPLEINNFVLQSTITCLAPVTVTGRANLRSGQIIGPQSLTVQKEVIFSSSSITITNGNLIMQGQAISSDYIYLYQAQSSKITIDSGSVWTLQNVRSVIINPAIIVRGALVYATGPLQTQINAAVDVYGTLDIRQSEFRIANRITAWNGSTIIVREAARLATVSTSNPSIFHRNSNLTILGTLRFYSTRGTHVIHSKHLSNFNRLYVHSAVVNVTSFAVLDKINAIVVISSSECNFEPTSQGSLQVGYAWTSGTLRFRDGLRIERVGLQGGRLEFIETSSVQDTVIGLLQWRLGSLLGRLGRKRVPTVNITTLLLERGQSVGFSQMKINLLKNIEWVLSRYGPNYFDIGTSAQLVIPREAIVNLSAESSRTFSGSGQMIVDGIFNVDTDDLYIRTKLKVNGELHMLKKNIRAYKSVTIQGKLVMLSDESIFYMYSSRHYFTANSTLDVRGRVYLADSRSHLTVESQMGYLKDIYVYYGTVTYDSSLLTLDTVTVYQSGSIFQCRRSCTIARRLFLVSGVVRGMTSNDTVIVGPNCTAKGISRYAYLGPGTISIKGELNLDVSTYFYVRGDLIIEDGGKIESTRQTVYVRGNGSVTQRDGGLLRVNYGSTLQFNTVPFYAYGRTSVEGFLRISLSSRKSSIISGTIDLPVSHGTFAVFGSGGLGRSVNITSAASVTGIGTIRVESGVLFVLADFSSFRGSLYAISGIVEIAATQKIVIPFVQINSGTLRISSPIGCYVDRLRQTYGILDTTHSGQIDIGDATLSHSGTITGHQTITVRRSFAWGSGGSLKSDVRVVVRGSLFVYGSYHYLRDNAELFVDANETSVYGNYFYFYDKSKLTVAQGCVLNVYTSTLGYGAYTGTLTNYGRIRIISNSRQPVYISVEIDNRGTIDVNDGVLHLQNKAGTALGGNLRGEPGSFLYLRGTTTLQPDAHFLLQNTNVYIYSTTYLYANTSGLTFGALWVSGKLVIAAPEGVDVVGDLTLTGRIEVASRLVARRILFKNGYLVRTNLNATAEIEELEWTTGYISSSPPKVSDSWVVISKFFTILQPYYRYNYIQGCSVTTKGSMVINAGSLYLQKGAKLWNEGNATSGEQSTLIRASDVQSQFINLGVLTIDVHGSTATLQAPILNYGKISILGGRVYFNHNGEYFRKSVVAVSSGAIAHFSSKVHRFYGNSQVNVEDGGTFQISSTVEFYANSTSKQLSKLLLTGTVRFHKQSRIAIDLFSMQSGYAYMNSSETKLTRFDLRGGYLTVGSYLEIDTLLMDYTPYLRGGRPQELGYLRVRDFVYTSGYIQSWETSGKYFVINVTRSFLIDDHYYVHSVIQCDIYNHGTLTSTFSRNSFSLSGGSRLINAASGRFIMKYGSFYSSSQAAGSLVNYGYISVGSFEDIGMSAFFVMVDGMVNISSRSMSFYRGGSCNGSGAIVIESDALMLIRSNTFTCSPSTFQGKGTMRIFGGILRLTSGSLSTRLEVQSGQLQVEKSCEVQMTDVLRLIGGQVVIKGRLSINNQWEFEHGSTSGTGIISVSKGATLSLTGNPPNGRTFGVQVQIFGIAYVPGSFTLTSMMRVEKTGFLQMNGVTRINWHNLGSLHNSGKMTCSAHYGAYCYVYTKFFNYRTLELVSNELRLNGVPRLVDGGRVTGPGTLRVVSSLYLGGISDSSITAYGYLYLTAPFLNNGTFTWTRGSYMRDSVADCLSGYSSAYPVLNPSCQEPYFFNQGSFIFAGSGYTYLYSLFVNNRTVQWDPSGRIYLRGHFVNSHGGTLNLAKTGAFYYVSDSGNFTNYGTIVVDNANVYMQYVTFANYGVLKMKNNAVFYSSYYSRPFAQYAGGLVDITNSRMYSSKINLYGGKFVGNGYISGSTFNNSGGTVEPTLTGSLDEANLTLSGSYVQGEKGKLSVVLREQGDSILAGLLEVRGDVNLRGLVNVTWDDVQLTDAEIRSRKLPRFVTYTGSRTGNFTEVSTQKQKVPISVVHYPKEIRLNAP